MLVLGAVLDLGCLQVQIIYGFDPDGSRSNPGFHAKLLRRMSSDSYPFSP